MDKKSKAPASDGTREEGSCVSDKHQVCVSVKQSYCALKKRLVTCEDYAKCYSPTNRCGERFSVTHAVEGLGFRV